MSIRKRFGRERLLGIAAQATCRSPLPNTQCTYMQQDGSVSHNTRVSFEWKLQVEGRQHRHVVSVTAGQASNQGVPLPESWRAAMACSGLDDIAINFAVEQSATLGLNLSCTILGQLAEPPEAGSTPGTVVALKAPRYIFACYGIAVRLT